MAKQSMLGQLLALLLAGTSGVYAQEIDVQGLASKLAPAITNSGKRAVAVVDFVDLDGNRTQFGRYLAEELSVSLFSLAAHIEVVDRAHVKTILAEHKLAEKGLVDPATVRQAASLVGADLLVTGTVTQLGGTVHITAKVLSADSGRIVGAASSDLPRTKKIDDMLAATGSGDSPGQLVSSGNSVIGTQSRSASMTTEAQQFSFTLQSCRLAGDNSVTCSLTVRNEKSDDRDVIVYYGGGYKGYSRLIDGEGREANLDEVELGGKRPGRVTLVSGVQTSLRLGFQDVSPNISSIALLEMSWQLQEPHSKGGERFKVQFRTIPVLR